MRTYTQNGKPFLIEKQVGDDYYLIPVTDDEADVENRDKVSEQERDDIISLLKEHLENFK